MAQKFYVGQTFQNTQWSNPVGAAIRDLPLNSKVRWNNQTCTIKNGDLGRGCYCDSAEDFTIGRGDDEYLEILSLPVTTLTPAQVTEQRGLFIVADAQGNPSSDYKGYSFLTIPVANGNITLTLYNGVYYGQFIATGWSGLRFIAAPAHASRQSLVRFNW